MKNKSYVRKGYFNGFIDIFMNFFKTGDNLKAACHMTVSRHDQNIQKKFTATHIINLYIEKLNEKGLFEFYTGPNNNVEKDFVVVGNEIRELSGRLRSLLRQNTENRDNFVRIYSGKKEKASYFVLTADTYLDELKNIFNEHINTLTQLIEAKKPKNNSNVVADGEDGQKHIIAILNSPWNDRCIKIPEEYTLFQRNLLDFYRVMNTQRSYLNSISEEYRSRKFEEYVKATKWINIQQQVEKLGAAEKVNANHCMQVVRLLEHNSKQIRLINKLELIKEFNASNKRKRNPTIDPELEYTGKSKQLKLR